MSPLPSDSDLVRQAQGGNQDAFEQLVRRTARWLYARIYVEVRDPHAAEDLVQESYMTAWKSIAQVTDPDGFRGWLATIAHTTVIDAARRQSRRKRGSGSAPRLNPEALASVPDTARTPDAEVQAAEDRQRVLGLLQSLPENYREPLMLRYLAGADYDAIGQQLGLSNGSLRGLLNRGMTMLRERLVRESRL